MCPGLDAHAAARQTTVVSAGGSAKSGAQSTVSDASADIQAIQAFNKRRYDEVGILKVEAQKKHKILFIMGVCLLLGILTTAGLGLAMVLGDRPVFMWHMAVAGITVTLAIVHAATSIIWFFPF
ncbi:MAG: hypothetical protein Q9M27_03170 [Mariprofundaceae bacterium]|nr:hypothetical protein [Mariprofundaceae bacterium]